MNIPHRCPICEGRGEIGKRLAQVGSVLVSEKPLRFKCHGCLGTGIVWDQTFQITYPNVLPYITNIPTWNNPKLDENGTPVVPFTTGVGIEPFTINSNPWRLITDHICGSISNPPRFCKYCFDTKRYNGASCSCSPEGMPHSQNCKGYILGQPSYEDFKDAA